MYIYNFRVFELLIGKRTAVISAAIIRDEDVNFRPDEYLVSLLGFEPRMKIPIVKITDYKLKVDVMHISFFACPLTFPIEYIRSYRLKRGAELLKSGFGSVLEAAF